MTNSQDVDQQSELVRLAERTAKAVETISTWVQVWSCLACLALVVAFVLFIRGLQA